MRISDTDGNKLYFADSGVELVLKGSSRRRKIFTVNSGQIIKRVLKAHKMTKFPSIGFNWKAINVLRDRLKKKYIFIVMGRAKYKVPIEDIIDNGKFLHFKHEGFELQVFYPTGRLDKWQYKKKKQ
jgi:hypothetical protein